HTMGHELGFLCLNRCGVHHVIDARTGLRSVRMPALSTIPAKENRPKGPHRQSTTAPTFPRGSATDLGDLICVLAFLHVHQLALAGADEAALLRPHPSDPLRLDLRAQLYAPVNQGFRADRTTGDEDTRRDDWLRTFDHR